MFHKGDFSAGVALLLKPRQSPTMCVQESNYIVQAVAVHVVYSHFAAAHKVAAKTAEYLWMIGPAFLTAASRRLLPPTVWVHDIQTAVPVDVADPNPMGSPIPFLRDVVDDPWSGWVGRIRLCVANIPIRTINDLRNAVPINVAHHSDLGLKT